MHFTGWKQWIISIVTGIIGFSIMVNAPSLFQGYGPQIAAVVIAAALLSPAESFLAILISSIIATPILIETHAIFPLVAYLSLILRSIEAYLSSYTKERCGYTCMGIVAGGFDGVFATIIGVLYYGNDGIHTALSVFGIVTGVATALSVKAWIEKGVLAGVASALGVIVFLLSTVFYLSPIGVLSLLATVIPFFSSHHKATSIASLILVILVAVPAIGTIGVNASILSYPFKPSSWTSNRWSIQNTPCGTTQNVFKYTHDPERLRIAESCVTLEGTVANIPKMFEDGDYCFDLNHLNESAVLSGGSIVLRYSHIHVEIQPHDRSRLLYNALSGKVCEGDKLVVSGPLVVDTDHGMWAEVHPLMNVTLVERGAGPCVQITESP
ncbi:MAG: hypothetical protein F7B60_01365 [Desulfurococcales archaeon]|nr:hypothetical protein [Desulfurococcales archaeon]